jgi:RNA polymerase sigma-70 factor (ECF subfamily)
MDDQALAEKAKSGCRASFAALIERHYDRIYRLAWRLCGERAQAEDIAQDVCVKLATAIGSFRGEAAFSTWVWRVTFTTASDGLRAARRMRPLEPSRVASLMDAGAEREPSPEDVPASGAELWDAVRALPGQQRDAVLLVYGEGLSHSEAALAMGCREKTVSWHLHEARKRLKIQLQTAV